MPEVERGAAEHDKADFAAIWRRGHHLHLRHRVHRPQERSQTCDLDPFRAYLDSIGDSLVIGEDDESFKVPCSHRHPRRGPARRPRSTVRWSWPRSRICGPRHDDLAAGRKAQSTDDLDAIEAELRAGRAGGRSPPEKRYGFVAVCAGDGLAAASGIWACDQVVISGGQTMNPSTEDILREIEPHPQPRSCSCCPTTRTSSWRPSSASPLAEGKQVMVAPHPQTIPQGICRPDERGHGGGGPAGQFLRP